MNIIKVNENIVVEGYDDRSALSWAGWCKAKDVIYASGMPSIHQSLLTEVCEKLGLAPEGAIFIVQQDGYYHTYAHNGQLAVVKV